MAITTGPTQPVPTDDFQISSDLQQPQPAQAPQQPLQLQPGQLPSQPAQAQPAQVAPAQPAGSGNARLKAFIGTALATLAGHDAPNYSVDASGKTVATPIVMTTGDKIRRIATHALAGLAAASQVPQQKSGLASALAGVGAGAQAASQQDQAQDALKRQQAKEDFETQQQATLRKMQNAQGNALTLSTLQHVHQEEIDHDPEMAHNRDILAAAEESGLPVSYMTGDQVIAKYHESPEQVLTEGRTFKIGVEPVVDPDGHPIIDSQTGQPKFQNKYATVDTMGDGKINLPQSFVSDVKKYLPHYQGVDGLTADYPTPVGQFVILHNKLLEAQKEEHSGWAAPQQVFAGKDGKTPMQFNPKAPEGQQYRPYPTDAQGNPVVPNVENKPLESAAKVAADENKGEITPADRFKEQQANYRAELTKNTSKTDAQGKAGATELQKQADDYSKFLFTAQSAKSSIMSAKNGDELANSLGPLQTALLVTSANGVHRINTTEVEAAGPKVGSFGRKIDAELEKAGKGQMPAATLKEMTELVDRYSKAKYGSYLKNAGYTARLRGLDPATTPVYDSDGNTVNLADATRGGAHLPPSPDPNRVAVQIPGTDVHFIFRGALNQFKKDHPNAAVGE